MASNRTYQHSDQEAVKEAVETERRLTRIEWQLRLLFAVVLAPKALFGTDPSDATTAVVQAVRTFIG